MITSDYGGIIGCACPGALADSSEYNIDGACFVEDRKQSPHDILCGQIVRVNRIVDGHHKEISCEFKEPNYDVAYGVALNSHYDTHLNDVGMRAYNSGDPISVVTHGRVWTLSKSIQQAPTPFAHVYIGEDGLASLQSDEEASGWRYTGGFVRWNEVYYLVEIQLIQSGAHLHGAHSIKVNGAEIAANRESPQRYDQTIRFEVVVSPENATNKAGEWSTSNPVVQITKISDHIVDVKGAEGSGFIGDFYVYWTATDGSGIQAMFPFTFSPT